MKSKLFVAGAAGVFAAAGCFNTFFPHAPDQIAETALRAQCHFLFSCCLAVERQAVGGSGAADEATCVEEGLETGGSSTLLGQRAKAAVDAGKAEVDTELADECMNKLTEAANSCDAQAVLRPAPDAACSAGFARAFTKGLVKDGKDCTDDLECADQGFCDRSADDGENDGDIVVNVNGKCVAAAGKGDDCSDTGVCQAGLTCGFDADTGDQKCEEIKLGGKGDECDGGFECESGNCVEKEVQTCSESGDACTADADCDEANFEFCEFDFTSTCGDAAKVEICDGK